MRIVHVITRLIIGGAQENTLLTCAGLAERGHDVTLISGTQTGPEGSLWDEARRSGIRLIELPSLVRQISPWTDWRCQRQLERLLTELGPDIVHTHSSKAGILGRKAAHRVRARAEVRAVLKAVLRANELADPQTGERPDVNALARRLVDDRPRIVHTIHGMSFNRTQPVLVRAAYRWLERRAAVWTDAFVSVADAMTDQAVAAGLAPRERFTTIYSGMRVEQFHPDPVSRARLRAEWGMSASDIIVCTVARLFRNKGYEYILAAMPRLIAADERLKFVWVGDGRDRAAYEAKLVRLGARSRVRLLGLVRPGEISPILGACDLLLHASIWEGLPRAAVQALLCEVPVVCFDVDGSREVVHDSVTGRLVPPRDAAGLAEAVIGLAAAPERRASMGQTGRQHCRERFDCVKMVETIEGLYVALARSSRPAPGY